MTKSELIAKLAAHFPQLGAADAELAVKMILDAMAKSRNVDGKDIQTIIQILSKLSLSYQHFKRYV